MSSEKRFMDFVKKDKQRVGVDAREKVSFSQMDPNGTSCYFFFGTTIECGILKVMCV